MDLSETPPGRDVHLPPTEITSLRQPDAVSANLSPHFVDYI